MSIMAFSFQTLLIRKYLYLLFYFSDHSQEIATEIIGNAREDRFLRDLLLYHYCKKKKSTERSRL